MRLIDADAAIDAVIDELKRVPTDAIRAKMRIEALPTVMPDTVKDLVTIFQNSKDMKLIARDGDLRADRIVTSALLTEDEAYQRGYEDGFREGRTRKELSEEKDHDQT